MDNRQNLKNIALQLEASSKQLEATSADQLKSLPSNRFREDLIEELIVAGLTTQEAELVGIQASINLSFYEPENPDFKSVIKSMVRTAIYGKKTIPHTINLEDPLLWTKMIQLYIAV